MSLIDEFEKQGAWLFRWRGYLPLLFLVFLVVALHDYQWPFRRYFDYEVWVRGCFALSMAGLIIRCITVGYTPAGTSGRNTKRQVAMQLNTTGMYSLTRHPLYDGNFVIGLGIALAPAVWWLPIIYCLLFGGYYERIMFAEEVYLQRRFGKEFDDWAAKTPAVFPNFANWRKPSLPFSFRNVLRREYSGLMIVILGSAGIQFTEHLIIDRRIVFEIFWVAVFIGGTAAYFILRSLKKWSTLLNVSGR